MTLDDIQTYLQDHSFATDEQILHMLVIDHGLDRAEAVQLLQTAKFYNSKEGQYYLRLSPEEREHVEQHNKLQDRPLSYEKYFKRQQFKKNYKGAWQTK